MIAKWLEPAMLPTDGEGILFFDELTSVQPIQQTTAYQVTLDRRIGEYIVPDGFHIIPAGNNQTDRAWVYPISTDLRYRQAGFPDGCIEAQLVSGIQLVYR
jgi:hypothetical protein